MVTSLLYSVETTQSTLAEQGIHAHTEKNSYKKCNQDAFFVRAQVNAITAMVFDGHGIDGERCSSCCKKRAQDFFEENAQISQETMKDLFRGFSKQLQEEGYEYDSGTTARRLLWGVLSWRVSSCSSKT